MSRNVNINQEYEVISQEAIINPLSIVGFKVKQSFQKIVNHFNDITNQRTADSKMIEKLEVSKKFVDNEKNIRQIGFIPFKDIKAPVPVGFKGNYLKLHTLLLDSLNTFSELESKTVVPAHNLVLRYLGKPELLDSINNDDYKDVNLYVEEIEQTKNKLNLAFDFNYNYQTQKINTLFSNINEIATFNNDFRTKGYSTLVQFQNQRLSLINKTKEMSKSIDLLMLRMEQKPDQYAINAINAEKLSNLVLKVAEAIEFSAMLQVYMEQTIVCGLETIGIFVTYVDRTDSDYQAHR